jgi:hypothetical protein
MPYAPGSSHQGKIWVQFETHRLWRLNDIQAKSLGRAGHRRQRCDRGSGSRLVTQVIWGGEGEDLRTWRKHRSRAVALFSLEILNQCASEAVLETRGMVHLYLVSTRPITSSDQKTSSSIPEVTPRSRPTGPSSFRSCPNN